MKKNALMLCALACAAMLACGRGGEKELKKAVDRCRGGDRDAVTAIAESLLKLAARGRFTGKFEAGHGMIFARGRDTIRLRLPVETSIPLAPDFQAGSADAESGRSAFANGKEVHVFDDDGDPEMKADGAGEGQVCGVSVSKEGVLYLQGGFLYEMSAGGVSRKALDAAVVAPPKNVPSLRAVLERRAHLVAVNCGNAGAYSLSMADLAGKKIVMKDFANASAKFGFDGESVYCITGGSGNWTLVKRAAATGRTEAIARFSGLLDVEFAADMMAAMEEKSFTLVDLKTKESVRAPFAYGVAGRSGDTLVLTWNEAWYPVDQRALFDRMKALRSELPALFAPAK